MLKNVSQDEVGACIKVAACICGKDGIISQPEEQSMFRLLSETFPEFCAEDFDKALNEFFDSDKQIEDYLASITDSALQVFTLNLAEESASADGLDIRENIALKKAYAKWGVNSDASHS